MYKTLALAAVAATATAQIAQTLLSKQCLTYSGFKYYCLDIQFAANAGAATLYNPSGPSVPNVMNSKAPSVENSETYAFNIFAYATLSYNHEIAENYKGSYDFTFAPINITPYGETVSWTRPEKGSFTFSSNGFRDVELLTFNTRVRTNAKTCAWTIFNMGTYTCAYNDDRVTDYQDSIWQFNGGKYITDMSSSLSTMYGPALWY